MAERYIFQVWLFLSKFYINLKLMNYKTWIDGELETFLIQQAKLNNNNNVINMQ